MRRASNYDVFNYTAAFSKKFVWNDFITKSFTDARLLSWQGTGKAPTFKFGGQNTLQGGTLSHKAMIANEKHPACALPK